MAVNLNFPKGSNADKDFMTCHLLTGIVARKVINNVLDRSVDALDSECRKVLHDLWITYSILRIFAMYRPTPCVYPQSIPKSAEILEF